MRRVTLLLALCVLVVAAVWALLIPTSLTCASIGHPEGVPCPERRIEFAEHGESVAVHKDVHMALRLGIVGVGTAAALGLLIAGGHLGREPFPSDHASGALTA